MSEEVQIVLNFSVINLQVFIWATTCKTLSPKFTKGVKKVILNILGITFDTFLSFLSGGVANTY